MNQPTPTAPTASLLLIMPTEGALRLYSEWLEGAGHKVRCAASLKEVEQACQSGSFDLILIADALEPKIKKAISLTVRHFFPEAPILQLGRTRPDIGGNAFVTGTSRDDVLAAIQKILRRDDIRPAAH